MHVIHTKHRRKGKFKFMYNSQIVLRSSVQDIQRFCNTWRYCIVINDGVNMMLLPESEA